MSLGSGALAAALLDAVEAENRERDGWRPAIAREKAEAILNGLLWLYGARAGSTASVYAADALDQAVDAVWPRRA